MPMLVLNVRRTVDLCIVSESTERRLTLCVDVEDDYFIHRLLCQCHWTMMIHSDVISFGFILLRFIYYCIIYLFLCVLFQLFIYV